LILALEPGPLGSGERREGEDEALLRAYVAAYRELPRFGGGPELGEWLAGFVERAGAAGRRPPPARSEFWSRLAAALAAESPALAAPELPERRWPVLPRLQRRRRR
jgi:hypothetical protein